MNWYLFISSSDLHTNERVLSIMMRVEENLYKK